MTDTLVRPRRVRRAGRRRTRLSNTDEYVYCAVAELRQELREALQGLENQTREARRLLTERSQLRDALDASLTSEEDLQRQVEELERAGSTEQTVQLSTPYLPNHILDKLWTIQDEKACGICTTPIEKRDDYRTTACGHVFCYECISSWLSAHYNCPMCRQTIQKL